MPESEGKRRVSQHGRGLPGGRSRVANYFEDTDGMDENEVRKMNLGRLRDLAAELGFDSLFDVAIAEAQSNSGEKERFLRSGQLGELVQSFGGRRKRSADGDHSLFEREVCDMSRDIYVREWRHLVTDSMLRKGSLPDDSPPDFAALYPRMKSHAPRLFDLLDAFLPEVEKESVEESVVIDLTKDEISSTSLLQRRKEERIVVAISILANQANSHNNAFQLWMGKMLYSHKFSKKLLNSIHELGISTSFSTVLKNSKLKTRPDSPLRESQTNQSVEPSPKRRMIDTVELPRPEDSTNHLTWAPIPLARPSTTPSAAIGNSVSAPTSGPENNPRVAIPVAKAPIPVVKFTGYQRIQRRPLLPSPSSIFNQPIQGKEVVSDKIRSNTFTSSTFQHDLVHPIHHGNSNPESSSEGTFVLGDAAPISMWTNYLFTSQQQKFVGESREGQESI